MKDQTRTKAVETLNKILEMELAGTIHYTHYSFMVYGYNRIPIVSWLADCRLLKGASVDPSPPAAAEQSTYHVAPCGGPKAPAPP